MGDAGSSKAQTNPFRRLALRDTYRSYPWVVGIATPFTIVGAFAGVGFCFQDMQDNPGDGSRGSAGTCTGSIVGLLGIALGYLTYWLFGVYSYTWLTFDSGPYIVTQVLQNLYAHFTRCHILLLLIPLNRFKTELHILNCIYRIGNRTPFLRNVHNCNSEPPIL
jgi:hypothetical protein